MLPPPITMQTCTPMARDVADIGGDGASRSRCRGRSRAAPIRASPESFSRTRWYSGLVGHGETRLGRVCAKVVGAGRERPAWMGSPLLAQ